MWRIATVLLLLVCSATVYAHNISDSNARFVEALAGQALIPFLYLGAKHMVTGVDHLLYLVGVVFYLWKPRDVFLYVTLFAVGHSLTLLVGVLGEVNVNARAIDAIIGFSIVYKAFENMGGFRHLLGYDPDSRIAVFIFGLFHGLGLATKLQELALVDDGLVANMVSFNVGVELGQVIALTFIFLVLSAWRQVGDFSRHAFAANTLLMTGGFLLAGYQLSGLLL